ncbi:MAG: C40 family peptidase [candidate division SR1 bacterium]|nr:C40 family peptidase [candidate division SR1 bacterium]
MLREEIARKYLENLKKEKPDIFITVAEDKVFDYLIDEGLLDQIHDAVVGKILETMSGSAGELKEFREKLKSVSTQEELAKLKHQIGLESTSAENQESAQSSEEGVLNTENGEDQNIENSEFIAGGFSRSKELFNDESFGGFEEQRPYIQRVLASAQKEIGKPYVRGGASPGGKGFDCSGLRNYAFGEQGMKFPTRFTAQLFDKTDASLTQDQVRIGDFMYWEQQPGKKKHSEIYHIEMVVGKPFLQNGKWMIKTIGSSTDRGILDENGNKTDKNGVGYRLREINDYRHFGRPPFYKQLADQEKKGVSGPLLASTKTLTTEQKQEILS